MSWQTIIYILDTLVMTFWGITVAIISVQNPGRFSLGFLAFQSIALPLGVILALSFGLGMLATVILQASWRSPPSRY